MKLEGELSASDASKPAGIEPVFICIRRLSHALHPSLAAKGRLKYECTACHVEINHFLRKECLV